jgi:hypothetical protein
MQLSIFFSALILSASTLSQVVDVDKVGCLVNQVRARYNSNPIKISDALNALAQTHSMDQRQRRQMTHTSANGKGPGDRASDAGYNFRTIGENVAVGQVSEQQVMEDWINSPGHLANIIRKDFKEMGIGRSDNYWTQEFGSRMNDKEIGTREPRCGQNEIKVQAGPRAVPVPGGVASPPVPAPSAAPVPGNSSPNVIIIGKENPLRPDPNPTPTSPTAISVPFFTQILEEIKKVLNSAPPQTTPALLAVTFMATIMGGFITAIFNS